MVPVMDDCYCRWMLDRDPARTALSMRTDDGNH